MSCRRIVNGTFNLDRSTEDIPCSSNLNDGVVQCCERGHACLTHGLCRLPEPGPGASGYYTSSCTDPLVRDSACVHYCESESFIDVVYNATARNWVCCGRTEEGIQCANPIGPTFDAPAPQDLGFYTATRSSSTSTAAAAATSAAASSSSTNSVLSSPTSGSRSITTPGAVAGAAIGAAAAVALLIALAWFLLRRRNRGKQALRNGQGLISDQQPQDESGLGATTAEELRQRQEPGQGQDDSSQRPPEISGTETRPWPAWSELDSSSMAPNEMSVDRFGERMPVEMDEGQKPGWRA